MLNPWILYSTDRHSAPRIKKLVKDMNQAVLNFPTLEPQESLQTRLHTLSSHIAGYLERELPEELKNNLLVKDEVGIIAQIFVPQSYRPSLYWYYYQYCLTIKKHTNQWMCDDYEDPRWQSPWNTGST